MKLLVSDFDLTFFDKDYDNNIKKVNEFVRRGNMFVIATGRPYGLLERDICNKNILYDYLICSDGAIILDKNGNIIYKNFLDDSVSAEVISVLKQDFNTEKVFVDKVSDGVSGIYGLFKNKKEANALLQTLTNNYSIDGYISLHWLNVLNKGITKVNGIEYLQNKLNIPASDIFVIGDGINDITMIQKYNGYTISKKQQEKTVTSFSSFMNIINKK